MNKQEAINQIYKACAEGDELKADFLYQLLDNHIEDLPLPAGIDLPLRLNIGLAYLKSADEEAEETLMPFNHQITDSIQKAKEYLTTIQPEFEQQSRAILKKGLESHLIGMLETTNIYCEILPAQHDGLREYCELSGLPYPKGRVEALEDVAMNEKRKIYGQPIKFITRNELN